MYRSTCQTLVYMLKNCSKCNVEFILSSDNFYIRNKDPLIYRNECKKCCKNRTKKHKKLNYERILETKRKYRLKNKDTINQKAKEYRKKPEVKERRKSYITSKDKKYIYNSRYYSKPGVKKYTAQKSKENYHKNIEQYRKKAREYKKREYVKEKTRKYFKKTNTPEKRLRATIKSSIRYYLKRRNSIKNGSLLNYLDYSLHDLKKHLENQFEPWMNWDNWGIYNANTWDDNDKSTWTWQVDHIIRHKEFAYDSMDHPDFKKCWSLDNLRPLSAKENVIRQ